MCTSVEISRLLLCVVLFKLATLREKWIVLHKEAMLHILKSIRKRRAVMFTALQENERLLLTATRLAATPRLRRTRIFWMLKR